MSFDDQQMEGLRDQNARYMDYLRDVEWWRYLDWLRDQANQQRVDELRDQANQQRVDELRDRANQQVLDELRDRANQFQPGDTDDRHHVQAATAVNEPGGRPASGAPPGDVRLVQPVAFEQLTDEQLQKLDTSATNDDARTRSNHRVPPVLPTAFEQLTDEQMRTLDPFTANPPAPRVGSYDGPTISRSLKDPARPGAGSRYDILTVSRDDIIQWVQQEELPSSASPLPAIPSNPQHETRVQQVVNFFLAEEATRRGSATKFQVLDGALGGLINLRSDPQVPRSSESLILRDAERYLWGRVGAAVAQKMHGYSPVHAEIVSPQLAPFWDLLKVVMRPVNALREALNLDPIGSQINPGKPQAAIGGGDWFELGLYHYWLLDQDSMKVQAQPALLDQTPRDVPGRSLLDEFWYGK